MQWAYDPTNGEKRVQPEKPFIFYKCCMDLLRVDKNVLFVIRIEFLFDLLGNFRNSIQPTAYCLPFMRYRQTSFAGRCKGVESTTAVEVSPNGLKRPMTDSRASIDSTTTNITKASSPVTWWHSSICGMVSMVL